MPSGNFKSSKSLIRIFMSTDVYAASTSKCKTATVSPLCNALLNSPTNSARASWVLLFHRNPCCCSRKYPVASRCHMSRRLMSLSKIFPSTDVRQIGLQFLSSLRSRPGFGRRIIFPLFQARGTSPVSLLLLSTSKIRSSPRGESDFNICAVRPSSPGAVFAVCLSAHLSSSIVKGAHNFSLALWFSPSLSLNSFSRLLLSLSFSLSTSLSSLSASPLSSSFGPSSSVAFSKASTSSSILTCSLSLSLSSSSSLSYLSSSVVTTASLPLSLSTPSSPLSSSSTCWNIFSKK